MIKNWFSKVPAKLCITGAALFAFGIGSAGAGVEEAKKMD
jgi:hypothetical protein